MSLLCEVVFHTEEKEYNPISSDKKHVQEGQTIHPTKYSKHVSQVYVSRCKSLKGLKQQLELYYIILYYIILYYIILYKG